MTTQTISAIPTQTDFLIMQGNTFTCAIAVFDNLGAPMDLTGYDVNAQMRKGFGMPVQIDCTIANGRVSFDNEAGGIIRLTLQPADTSAIRATNSDDTTIELIYDIELTSADIVPVVTKPAFGNISLQREVTTVTPV